MKHQESSQKAIKRTLSCAWHAEKQVARLAEEIKQLEQLAAQAGIGGISYGDKVAHSRSRSAPYEQLVHQLVDLQAEMGREIERVANQRHAALQLIRTLEDPVEAEVLYKYYLGHQHFNRISEEIDRSVSRTRRIYNTAINHLCQQRQAEQSAVRQAAAEAEAQPTLWDFNIPHKPTA